jgi:asparagine synthase (glutamine-hydrolysing)
MCGIAAVFFNDRSLTSWAQNTVDKMLTKIEHRGFAALSRSSVVGLSVMGCVRLPIRDPIAGDQPSYNSDFSVAALLNGEIYNIEEFRNAASPDTTSDTAALPQLYRSSKDDSSHDERLLQCRGMYAIVLHDTAGPTPVVKILRDHIGIKPLWMAYSSKGILIASESKAFGGQSFISAREVRPGEMVVLTHTGEKWVEHESTNVRAQLLAGFEQPHDQLAISLRNVISTAVRAQWPAEDLPVAVLCSGGIDSSIITYELSRCRTTHPEQPVVAYTGYCTDSARSSANNDIVAARQLCAELRIPLREVQIAYDDLFNVLGDVIYHVETFEPNVVRNSAIQYHVIQKIAADGFRVAFCGEGADELFWGYADFAEIADPEKFSSLLLEDLYRTQLLRVDRIGMAHTVEVRVPFLDESLVRFASRLTSSDRRLTSCGIWLGKAILREAYAGKLPDEIVLRRKATLAYGAGFGGVEMDDPIINDRSRNLLRARGESLASIRDKFPKAFPLGGETDERALYVQIFNSLGFEVPEGYEPPRFAKVERTR